jgi:hypothetical protein
MSNKVRPKVAPVSTAPKATGWIGFAGVLMVIGGVLNIIDGIAAVSHDQRFDASQLLFSNLTAWGWAYIVFGAVQLLGAVLLFKSHASGMLIAVTIACISGTAHFMSIGVYPIWSVTLMAVNFAILFGLLTHSDAFTE